ncbi:hypothetical protein [Natrinema sp. 1APR25-10V2]|uniref:hypothetical protein n=1 Tax=Natrinema sp. 1APR25-10V2 TaxID=2951081 RepID=UPI0028743F2A|nr:hypothetical protein [Natrinema sp. 1APR25-10V2]MDS0473739.1 hypothetical protein [Natrinema sp. 1APR25-10V2]
MKTGPGRTNDAVGNWDEPATDAVEGAARASDVARVDTAAFRAGAPYGRGDASSITVV